MDQQVQNTHSPALDRTRIPSYPRTLVPPCFFTDPSVMQEWRYESRRLAQQIQPHLWLGSMSSARDDEFLLKNNIKLAIAVTSQQTADLLKNRIVNAERDLFILPVTHVSDLVPWFSVGTKKIDEIQRKGGSTLVFCETGNEKSAAVVVAYIMEKTGWDLIKSVQYVESKRFCVALNDIAKFQLRTYETIWRARQAVTGCEKRLNLRRTIDDIYEDEDYMKMKCSELTDREGKAPFHDIEDGDVMIV
ncbi:protein-tyrosine phosphatase-like protein [Dipodascopsis uninucleata]